MHRSCSHFRGPLYTSSYRLRWRELGIDDTHVVMTTTLAVTIVVIWTHWRVQSHVYKWCDALFWSALKLYKLVCIRDILVPRLSPSSLFLRRAHAQGVKQSVLSVCVCVCVSVCLSSVSTKIGSGHLGIWRTRKYNKSVEILVSICFKSFGKAHEHRNRYVFVGHAYRPYPLLPRHVSCAQPSTMHRQGSSISSVQALQLSMHVDVDADAREI
jgi:hypothetical protein